MWALHCPLTKQAQYDSRFSMVAAWVWLTTHDVVLCAFDCMVLSCRDSAKHSHVTLLNMPAALNHLQCRCSLACYTAGQFREHNFPRCFIPLHSHVHNLTFQLHLRASVILQGRLLTRTSICLPSSWAPSFLCFVNMSTDGL